jgi:signal transduction histidine kinase
MDPAEPAARLLASPNTPLLYPAPNPVQNGKVVALTNRITDRKMLRVLIIGFAMVIVLLVAAAIAGLASVQQIRGSASALVDEQVLTTRLIDEVQRQQGALSAVFHRLAGDPESIDRDQMVAQLDAADRAIDSAVSSATSRLEQNLWRALQASAMAFTSEARQFLFAEDDSELAYRNLVHRHEDVLSVVTKLISASQQRAFAEQERLERRSQSLVQEAVGLLGMSILLSLVCAILTVRIATELFRKMEWQSGELSRVSWHLLERQETAARRFSHELHDELGQSLAAVKANLVALERGSEEAAARRDDCLRLVEEAIGNVRELSQFLRPTILDDFGLDASLRWLADRFTQRTGIHVEYESDFTGRLTDETETHLFRIAQEALTNVARHSGAKKVTLRLHSARNAIVLSISDDGKGFSESLESRGLGIVGMRARARSAGGEVSISSATGSGVQIEASVPARSEVHETENSSFARG